MTDYFFIVIFAANYRKTQNTKTEKMEFHIRRAETKDASACFELIKELALFEKEPEAVKNTLKQFEKDGFGENPIYKMFVAELANGQIAGMALFFIGYSTWKGKLLYLDDLMVGEKYRSNGIGQELINVLFEYAKNNEVKVIKWQVLDWNTPAIEFYEKLNMKMDGSWINCSKLI